MKHALAGFVAIALLFTGCAAATAELPTAATLTGTWKKTKTVVTSGTSANTQVTDYTHSFTGTEFTMERVSVVTPVTGSVQRYYNQDKGTFSLSGDLGTWTKTTSRSSSSPFPDATTGWSLDSTPQVTTCRMVLVDGKLYG